ANRFLTAFQNLFLGAKLSEYHTGFRAFARDVLLKLPLFENADGFVFDNEVLAQCIYFGLRIGEISCPSKYFEEASSIRFGPTEMSLARRAFGVGRLAAALTRPSVLGRKALGRGKREQAPALESAQPNRDQDGCIETSGNGRRGVYRLEFHPILSRCPSRLR